MATTSDIANLNKVLDRLGKDVCEKQEIIRKKAEKGRKYMNILKMGIDTNINENDYNEIIMNLLHYKQYNIITQQIFLEWNSDEMIESNGVYSEQSYIEAGKLAKQRYDDYNEELFEITMTDLLFYKAKGEESKIDKLYDIYHSLMGKEWLDAKMLKSLKKT
jgi:hypothetical protein